MHTLDNKPEVGDLVMNDYGEVGIITLIEPIVGHPYFVEWVSGIFTNRSTSHPIEVVSKWRKNFKK